VLAQLVAKVGAERVLLGSDYPVGEAKPVEFVRETDTLTAAQKDQIVRTNGAMLLGLN
jgi:aminocarboxymuconate-semialdehyde decarboxylase